MKFLYAAASIAAALLAAAIATSGVPLSEPFYYMLVATLTLVAIGMLYLTLKRKENAMSDDSHEDAGETHATEAAVRDTRSPVSHSPLRYVVERDDYFQEFLGIALLVGTIVVLIMVLFGTLDFEGSVNIHGIWIPWIIGVVIIAQWIYQHQDRISFIRPTGPKAGWFFGFIDAFLSVSLAVIAFVMLAGVVVRWGPPQVVTFWQTWLWFIPLAKYTTTSLVVGFVFALYGGRDVRKQFQRARHGREALISQRAKSAVPADCRAITVPKSKIPHGFALFRRKPNLDIDYDNGPLNVG